MKSCNHCGGSIGGSATKCPHCGGYQLGQSMKIFIVPVFVLIIAVLYELYRTSY